MTLIICICNANPGGFINFNVFIYDMERVEWKKYREMLKIL